MAVLYLSDPSCSCLLARALHSEAVIYLFEELFTVCSQEPLVMALSFM